MKIISFILALFSFFITLLGFLPEYKGGYEDDPSIQPPVIDYNKEFVAINESRSTIINQSRAIGLDVSNNNLFVTYFGATDGESYSTSTSLFALPSKIQKSATVLSYTYWTDYSVSWTYSGIKAYEGEENDKPTKGVTYEFDCSAYSLKLSVTCKTAIEYNGPFEFETVLTNNSAEKYRLKPGDFAGLTLSCSNSADKLYYIAKESGQAEGYTHSGGGIYSGSGIYEQTAAFGTSISAWANTYQDWNSNGYYPVIFLQKEDEGAYVALEWSSGQVKADCNKNTTAFTVNMDKDGDFVTPLNASSAFTFPTVYLGSYSGSLDSGSNAFKKWFFGCKVPKKLRDDENEPLTQTDMQSGLNTYGCEAIKWDYGWWSNEQSGTWKSHEGSWILRNTDYINALKGYQCNTMSEFGALAKSNGIDWTVYLLLHDTMEGGAVTDAYGEFNSLTHADWFSNRRVATGMGLSADLGNVDCVNYLKTALSSFFKNNNIATWRSDFEPICSSSDKENRHLASGTDVQYWCTVGFGEVVDYIYDNVPGFRYESCSSGGSMKDLFTATKAVVINCDDAANYLSMRMSFYDSSYVINPTQLQMPCNIDNFNVDKPSFYPACSQGSMTHEEYKAVCLDMGFRSMMLGVPMFSSWTCNYLPTYYEKYTDMYKNKIRPLIRNGDLYHILPRPDGVNWDGVSYVDNTASDIKAVAFLFKPSPTEGNTKTIKFEGLVPTRNYTVTFEDNTAKDKVMSGKQLMETGLTVSITTTVGSEIVWLS